MLAGVESPRLPHGTHFLHPFGPSSGVLIEEENIGPRVEEIHQSGGRSDRLVQRPSFRFEVWGGERWKDLINGFSSNLGLGLFHPSIPSFLSPQHT